MRRCAILAITILAAACGDGSPTNVAGDYTLALTNHENGCSFQTWTVGDTTTGLPLTIVQNGTAVTGVIGGAAGTWMRLVLGSDAFAGTVTGNALHLVLNGTRAYTEGGCTYTIIGTADAEVAQDVLTGGIVYTTATNGSPDCGALAGCQSIQVFNGTRPPP
jgi:hypothetical protein